MTNCSWQNFFFKLGTKTIPCSVTEISYAVDVNTGEKKDVKNLAKNEIASCKISLADRIVIDEFKNHKTMGEFILIDRVTNTTYCLPVSWKKCMRKSTRCRRRSCGPNCSCSNQWTEGNYG